LHVMKAEDTHRLKLAQGARSASTGSLRRT
jgi:hypothetical protein